MKHLQRWPHSWLQAWQERCTARLNLRSFFVLYDPLCDMLLLGNRAFTYFLMQHETLKNLTPITKYQHLTMTLPA